MHGADRIKMNDIEKFTKKYYISIVNDMQKCAKPRHLNMQFNANNVYLGKGEKIADSAIDTHYEKLLTITIPESSLDQLIDIDALFYDNIENGEVPKYLFGRMMDRRNAEQRIRKRNIAAQEAYEKYQTLLNLAADADEYNDIEKFN